MVSRGRTIVAASIACACAGINPDFDVPVDGDGTASSADDGASGESESGTASASGDGDGTTGDGDGTTGDGDGTTGDGDGTTGDATTGDGTTGDGTTGDGDGTTGDGTSGDGTTGDGDGTTGDGTTGDGDGTSGDGDGTAGDGTSGDGDGTTGDGDGTTGGRDCLDLLTATPGLPSGTYTIDPDGPGGIPPFDVECDMESLGGGWTMLSAEIASGFLGATLTCSVAPPVFFIDATGVPTTQDEDGNHLCYFDFAFPSGFDEFLLRNFEVEGNGNPDSSEFLGTEFAMTDWAVGFIPQSTGGDVAFGSPTEPGPATSFAAGGMDTIVFPGEVAVLSTPVPLSVPAGSTAFRVAISEKGNEFEGWRAWSGGFVGVR